MSEVAAVSGAAHHPIGLDVTDDLQRSRLTTFFRLILAIPALIIASIFQQVVAIVAFLAWFYILFTGGMHGGMRDLAAWMLRYETQTYGYVMLITGRYPSLAGAPTA